MIWVPLLCRARRDPIRRRVNGESVARDSRAVPAPGRSLERGPRADGRRCRFLGGVASGTEARLDKTLTTLWSGAYKRL